MQSKNKAAPTADEKRYIEWVKDQECVICNAHGPSECHEINQGQWHTSMPLCPDCHRGSFNGIHGQKRMWILTKMDELSALNKTIRRFAKQFLR